MKREPSPELAKISALVTRPPKQKAPSKKTEEGNLDLYPALSSESSFSSSLSLSSTPRKRPIFKPLASPPPYSNPKTPSPPLQQQQSTFFYVVSIFLTFLKKKQKLILKSDILTHFQKFIFYSFFN